MSTNNRITYRFDEKGRSMNAAGQGSLMTSAGAGMKPADNKVVSLRSSPETMILQELNPWHSPFQDDVVALEELIRSTEESRDKEAELASERVARSKEQKRTESEAASKISFMKAMSKGDADIPSLEHPLNGDRSGHAADPYFEDEYEMGYNSNSLNRYNGNEYPPLEEEQPERMTVMRYKRHTAGPSWLNVILSVSGALATGAVFGYLLLSLFSGSFFNKDSSQPSVPVFGEDRLSTETNNAGDHTSADEQSGADPDISDDAMPFVSLTGLDRAYYFIQYGVFSNAEGRDLALVQLADKGLASAVMNTPADYRVFAGMAVDRSKALMISTQLPDLEVYIKEISIKAPNKLSYSGDGKEAQLFFERTAGLVEMLDILALTQLEQSSLSALNDAAASAWKLEHQRWTESAAAMQKGIEDGDAREKLDKMIKSINTAAKSMVEYDKQPARSFLWSTQSALMEAVITQKEWFETNSAL